MLYPASSPCDFSPLYHPPTLFHCAKTVTQAPINPISSSSSWTSYPRERTTAESSRLGEALNQIKEKYCSLFDHALEGIVQFAPDGRLIAANPSLASICGYDSPEELLSCLPNIESLYLDLTARAAFICDLHRSPSYQQRETQIYHQNGYPIWIVEKLRAVCNDRGEVRYYEGFVEDITDKKDSEAHLQEQAEALQQTQALLQQTQAQLIHAEKLSVLGQMLAGVAHEINNPVSFVCGNLVHTNQYTQDLLGLLKLYQRHNPCPPAEIEAEMEAIDLDFLLEDLPRTLASIQVGADRIRQISLSLRNFSRADESDCQPVNLHEGIDSTLLILQSQLKATDCRPAIAIVREYGDLPPVECFVGQMNQVFMNILSNAVDALDSTLKGKVARAANDPDQCSTAPLAPAEPTIRIRTEQNNPNWVTIRIADNGPGLESGVKQRIFDPFFTTKPVGKGTGLGLSISYQIVVERHGGKLNCRAEPGKGTEFIIQIPLKR